MTIIIWLIVWLLNGTPELYQWNNWAVALTICLVLEVFGGGSKVR